MEPSPAAKGAERRRVRISYVVLFAFLAIAAFFLILEHRAHLLGWLPFLIILLCPLLHIFMHGRGHGGHGGHGGEAGDRDADHARNRRPY